jgi:hypothetical protein
MELSAAGTQAPAASAANLNSLAASLGHIAGLFSAGLLTESEFSAAKSTVLGLASPQQPVAVPAAAAEAPAVLLAAVMAEQVDEPVMAAAVPVEEHTRIHTAVAEHRVVARGKEKKKRKRAERASSDSDDTDSDGTNCQRNGAARTPAHQSAQQDQFPPGLVFNKAWDLEGLTWYGVQWCRPGSSPRGRQRMHEVPCLAALQVQRRRADGRAHDRLVRGNRSWRIYQAHRGYS